MLWGVSVCPSSLSQRGVFVYDTALKYIITYVLFEEERWMIILRLVLFTGCYGYYCTQLCAPAMQSVLG